MTSENVFSSGANVLAEDPINLQEEVRPVIKNVQFKGILNADPTDVLAAARFSRVPIPHNTQSSS